MFTVVDKKTGQRVTVYGMDGPWFLVYDDVNCEWIYRRIEEFIPDSETRKEETHEESED